MRLNFCLAWVDSGRATRKAFKLAENYALFTEYVSRITKFCAAETSNNNAVRRGKKTGVVLWLCDRGRGSQMFSSEELAESFQKVLDSGVKELQIVIGGPDGFSSKELQEWQPELRWSFGPLTLPHELAAVVASEQIYRALTILHNLPYHSTH